MNKKYQVLMKRKNELSPEIIDVVNSREEAEYVIAEHLINPMLCDNEFHILEVYVYDTIKERSIKYS